MRARSKRVPQRVLVEVHRAQCERGAHGPPPSRTTNADAVQYPCPAAVFKTLDARRLRLPPDRLIEGCLWLRGPTSPIEQRGSPRQTASESAKRSHLESI